MSGGRRLVGRILLGGSLRSVPLWLVITAVNTSVLFGFVALDQAREAGRSPSQRALILVLWLAVAIYLLTGRVRSRCRRIDLVLPLAARELWLAHFLSSALAGSLVLAGSLGVVVLHQLLLRNLRGEPLFRFQLGELAAPLFGGLLLALAVVQSYRPALRRLPLDRRTWSLLVGVALAVPALLVALVGRPWLATVVCCLLALAIGVRTWRTLPPALLLVPLRAAPPSAAPSGAAREAAAGPLVAAQGTSSVGMSRPRLWRLAFAVIHHVPPWQRFAPWVLYTVILGFGFLVAGGYGRWVPAEEMRLVNLPLAVYMLLAGTGVFLYHLFRLDPMPVSRRLVFALLMLPSLLTFCAGYGVGRLLVASSPLRRAAVEYRVVTPYSWVDIDPGFMGVAADGEVPTLTAPWGESHRAWHRPLFRGSSVILFHPFATSEESSVDFEAWLTSRAVAAVYDVEVPLEEIRDRYFEIEGDRIVGVEADGAAMWQSRPGLRSPPVVPEAPIFLALVLVPWLLLVALLVTTLRATASVKRTRTFYWIVLGILIAGMLGQVVLSINGFYSPAAAAGILAVALRRLAATPGLSLLIWAGSLAFVFAAYRLAERRFRRAEIPASPINCSFIDWEREG